MENKYLLYCMKNKTILKTAYNLIIIYCIVALARVRSSPGIKHLQVANLCTVAITDARRL